MDPAGKTALQNALFPPAVPIIYTFIIVMSTTKRVKSKNKYVNVTTKDFYIIGKNTGRIYKSFAKHQFIE